jgi:hypothetical protein
MRTAKWNTKELVKGDQVQVKVGDSVTKTFSTGSSSFTVNPIHNTLVNAAFSVKKVSKSSVTLENGLRMEFRKNEFIRKVLL